jgi:hypothetical protein
MPTLFRRLIYVLLICSSLYSCNRQHKSRTVTRGFYYWRSSLQLSADEQKIFTDLQITKLYCKFFDISFNSELQQPLPAARLSFDSSSLSFLKKEQIKIIPVVFITNETLAKIDSLSSIQLANKIILSVSETIKRNQLVPANEFQLDCDWTVSTKKKYFALINEVKRLIRSDTFSFSKNVLLSATIRLHQVKFSTKSGIPGIDKGLLMCYNMGNLKNPSTGNSILDVSELKKYLGGLEHYPLHIDVALPIFNWNVLFRNNQYTGIVSNISPEELNTSFGRWDHNRFVFLKDTVFKNISFQKNDLLRSEESNANELTEAAKYVSENLSKTNTELTVLFYHADKVLLNKHNQHDLENLFRRFY